MVAWHEGSLKSPFGESVAVENAWEKGNFFLVVRKLAFARKK